MISLLLFRVFFGSVVQMKVFSIRQSWHERIFLLYEGAFAIMDHVVLKGTPLSFNFQMCRDKVVSLLLFLCLKEALWFAYLCLKEVEVRPMYS